jgi:hypothetical protein
MGGAPAGEQIRSDGAEQGGDGEPEQAMSPDPQQTIGDKADKKRVQCNQKPEAQR